MNNEEEKKNTEPESIEEAVSDAAETVEEMTQDIAEVAEDTDDMAEEVSEAVEDAEEVSDTAGEADGNVSETAEDAADGVVEAVQNTKKQLSGAAIAALAGVGVVVIAIIVILAVVFGKKVMKNKYEKDYTDIEGKTAADIADQSGMEYEDFLAYYDLPKDLPKDTNSNATESTIPVRRYAELTGADFETLKENLGWDDSITEDMTWGEAIDKTKLSYYVGEENLDAFKAYYGLDDSITGDTTWGEIRHVYEQKQKEMFDAQQAGIDEADDADDAVEAGAEAESEENAEDGEVQETEQTETE